MSGWIDLTSTLNDETWIYSEEGYSDPGFAAKPWAHIAENRFEVWQLELGTQCGTHIDAPAHFVEGGATIDTMRPDDMIGRYRRIAANLLKNKEFQIDWGSETHLLLDARASHLAHPEALSRLLELPPRVWVLAGELRIADDDPLWLHLNLCRAGKFLAEDLCVERMGDIPETGEIATVPLHLTGVSGSPARVLLKC